MISATVYVEHPDLALADTIERCPDAEIVVHSNTGTDPVHDTYFFRIDAPDFDRVERALSADHTVEEAGSVLELEGRRVYRIEYADEAKLITPSVTDHGGLVLTSKSREAGWELTLHLDGRSELYALSEDAAEEGMRFEIRTLQDAEADAWTEPGPTEPQREALVTAYRHGYFDERREITLAELGERLGGISATAAARRVKRGSAALVEAYLLDGERE